MSAPMTPEQRKAIAVQIGDVQPATDALIGSFAESVANVRNHEHPTWEDLYCMNLTSYMGERMAPVLKRLLGTETENARLRGRVAELEGAAVRKARPVTACEACGDLPEKWCPDCAACKAGCFGGHDGNPCTHPNARWAAPAPVEDPHDSPLHHSYALGRDLPEVTP